MDNLQKPKSTDSKPDYVVQMEDAYGAPSQTGFGSAVFFEHMEAADDLEQAALQKYQYFVGDTWERFGADAWMSAWKQVYMRPAGADHDVVAELRGITDLAASLSVSMILDNIENAEDARAALAKAFDEPTVAKLAAYTLGDGEAMSGILVVGQRTNGETTFLAFLLD